MHLYQQSAELVTITIRQYHSLRAIVRIGRVVQGRIGPSIRRFGRGKYDHVLIAAVFQHRITAERRANRRDFRVLERGDKSSRGSSAMHFELV